LGPESGPSFGVWILEILELSVDTLRGPGQVFGTSFLEGSLGLELCPSSLNPFACPLSIDFASGVSRCGVLTHQSQDGAP
jgi:hypothetical protein